MVYFLHNIFLIFYFLLFSLDVLSSRIFITNLNLNHSDDFLLCDSFSKLPVYMISDREKKKT